MMQRVGCLVACICKGRPGSQSSSWHCPALLAKVNGAGAAALEAVVAAKWGMYKSGASEFEFMEGLAAVLSAHAARLRGQLLVDRAGIRTEYVGLSACPKAAAPYFERQLVDIVRAEGLVIPRNRLYWRPGGHACCQVGISGHSQGT